MTLGQVCRKILPRMFGLRIEFHSYLEKDNWHRWQVDYKPPYCDWATLGEGTTRNDAWRDAIKRLRSKA